MKIKLLFGFIATVGLSVLLYFKGVIGVGLLVCVALAGVVATYIVIDNILMDKGRDSTVLIKAGFFFILAVAMAFLWYTTIKYDYKLYTHGIKSVAVVTGYERTVTSGRRGRVRFHDTHTLTYEGYSTKLDLDKQYPVGTRLPVRYLQSNPKFARVIDPSATISSTFGFGDVFMACLMLLWVGLGLIYLKEFASSKS
jgi:hypothetical protein